MMIFLSFFSINWAVSSDFQLNIMNLVDLGAGREHPMLMHFPLIKYIIKPKSCVFDSRVHSRMKLLKWLGKIMTLDSFHPVPKYEDFRIKCKQRS